MHSSSAAVLKSGRQPCARAALRFEDVNSPHHVLPADGALAHPLPALGASYHVTTFQEHTIDDGVHADATQVFIRRQLSSNAICGGEEQFRFGFRSVQTISLMEREGGKKQLMPARGVTAD